MRVAHLLLPTLVVISGLHPDFALAQIRFPSNPTSSAQCDAGAAQWKAMYRQHQELASQGIANRNRLHLSRDCAGNERCRAQYYHQAGEYHKIISHHHQERDRIEREGRSAERACRTVAQAHERQAEQQRQVAEENRRMQERHANEQRRMAEANERRTREAYEENQRRQYAAQLEQQRRQTERNQPRVIAQTNPGYYDNRNAPRVVQTPQQAAQSRIEAQQRQQLQQQQEAQALRDVATQLTNMAEVIASPPDPRQPAAPQMDRGRRLAAENDAARRRMLDTGLNPQGHQNAQLNSTVGNVQETNTRMNRGGPVVTQIQNDAYAATGSVANSTLGQYDQAMANATTGAGAGSGGNPSSSSQYVPQAVSPPPSQVASAPTTPETACGRRRFLAFNLCMARECEKPQFKGHAQCRDFEPPANTSRD